MNPRHYTAAEIEQLRQWQRESLEGLVAWIVCLILCWYYAKYVTSHPALMHDGSLVLSLWWLLPGFALSYVTTALSGGVAIGTMYYFADGYFTMTYRG